jgi:hypothetical protein
MISSGAVGPGSEVQGSRLVSQLARYRPTGTIIRPDGGLGALWGQRCMRESLTPRSEYVSWRNHASGAGRSWMRGAVTFRPTAAGRMSGQPTRRRKKHSLLHAPVSPSYGPWPVAPATREEPRHQPRYDELAQAYSEIDEGRISGADAQDPNRRW